MSSFVLSALFSACLSGEGGAEVPFLLPSVAHLPATEVSGPELYQYYHGRDAGRGTTFLQELGPSSGLACGLHCLSPQRVLSVPKAWPLKNQPSTNQPVEPSFSGRSEELRNSVTPQELP